MTDRRQKSESTDSSTGSTKDWSAGWESQKIATLESSLAATPAQRLEWLEEALEIAWASGALPRE